MRPINPVILEGRLISPPSMVSKHKISAKYVSPVKKNPNSMRKISIKMKTERSRFDD
jgi:hypothetical protein